MHSTEKNSVRIFVKLNAKERLHDLSVVVIVVW
jgi:hypothetical protein